jgi:ribosomal protein S11
MAKTASKKRKVIVESIGEAHVTASFNNIIISLTNTKGEVISWSSAGKWVLEVLKKTHLMPLRQLLKIVQRLLRRQDSVK